MNETTSMEELIREFSIEITRLEKERDDITNKLSDVIYKRDILQKACEVIGGGEIFSRLKKAVKEKEQVIKPIKKGRGLTAATFKILSTANQFLSVPEIHKALLEKGFHVKVRNVYILLYRQEKNNTGKIISKTENGHKKYALAKGVV